MKRILLGFSLLLSLSLSAQSWQSKPVVRIEDAGQSFLYTFSDSSDAYINKCNVSYIVNLPNSQWVQLGYMYDGSTSRIITASYSAITQPDLASAKILSDTLNAWLVDCAVVVGDSTLQTLSIYGDTLSISDGNSVILPVYVQVDSAVITSYDVLNSQNAPPGSPAIGDTYLVGTSPSGAWVGHAKDIAEWNGSSWDFTDGVQGDFLYNATNALTYIFRSGNWVQTTGIPALNNGNNISSGLKIGTNNARSLTFETNNANRGRFDSIGRFHVYNLPTASTADTFVTKSDLGGKLTKVGQSTFLSGGAFIPLSGTVSGSPVTGDIEMYDGTTITQGVNNFQIGKLSKDYFQFSDEGRVILSSAQPEISKGISGSQDFTPNITDLDYTQKIYVGFRGTATLSSGTVTVATDKIKTGYKIYLSVNTPSGTQGFLSAPTGSIVDATEFVINSTNAGDNSTVNWWIAP